MAGQIFINYRRDDSAPWAGRLCDRLMIDFAPEQIFMDVTGIEPGLDFAKVLRERIATCLVLIVMIGPDWLEVRDENGRRRLDDPEDFVRMEIEAALKRDIRVIPILIGNTRMPGARELPEGLAPLALRNARTVTHQDFTWQVRNLVELLKQTVPFSRSSLAARGTPIDNSLAIETIAAVSSAIHLVDGMSREFEQFSTNAPPQIPKEYGYQISGTANHESLVTTIQGQELQRVTYNELATKLTSEDLDHIRTLETSMNNYYQQWKGLYPTLALETDPKAKDQKERQIDSLIVSGMGRDLGRIISFIERCGLSLDDHYVRVRDLAEDPAFKEKRRAELE
jgi:hypothetical protein